MSPEQSRGEAVDGRADVYSLGVVLYEMLAGDVPFDGESTVSILLKQVTEPPKPIPGLSPLVQNVLDRALAKNVKDRFQTPMELAEAFSAAVGMKSEAATIEFNELPTILPSEALSLSPLKIEKPGKVEPLAKTEMEPPAKPQRRWLFIALPAIVAIAFGGFFWMNGFPSSTGRYDRNHGSPCRDIHNNVHNPVSDGYKYCNGSPSHGTHRNPSFSKRKRPRRPGIFDHTGNACAAAGQPI